MCDDDDQLDQLARHASDGDEVAFTRFVTAATPFVHRVASQLATDRQSADDIAQETFVRVFVAFEEGRYASRGTVAAWLRRIAVRIALDDRRSRRRRRAREASYAEGPVSQSSPAEAQVHVRQVAAALASLPPAQRVALVLRQVEGLSTRETAAAMDCSEGAVEQRLVRARAALRKRFSYE